MAPLRVHLREGPTDEALKVPSRFVERRQKIKHVVRQHVSYEDMARLALGMPWIELTDTERQECVYPPISTVSTPTPG